MGEAQLGAHLKKMFKTKKKKGMIGQVNNQAPIFGPTQDLNMHDAHSKASSKGC